jgi:transposase
MEAAMADGGHLGDRKQFWQDHVAGWKSSGLSLRLYSEEHGLKAGTLGYWNSRLKAQAADALTSSTGPGTASTGPETAATFLAVHVADPAVSVPEPRNEGVELVLPGGYVVRIGRGFDAMTLDRLLDVVERRS